MKRTLFTILLLAGCLLTQAQQTDYTSILNVNYYPESERVADEYISERCVLDLYHPENAQGSAAVAWVFNHIEEFGGDPELLFISGHSAGGYLTSMVGL
ncbi:MAG: carboxylesterase family protein, partial [Bacteroidales bacterium]|nr:carboxylesterase family protein [Bacteroidales bacterium]